uniref:Rhodanese domain-containing protein n=1 Tax=Oryza rufipogon TaxID=4529 RepID=A0A0E0NH97_ORYRU
MAAPPSPLGLARRVSGAGAATPAAAWSSSCRSRRLRPRLLPSKRWSGVVRMGAAVGGEQEGEDEEVKLAKEMAAARRRWETLIREQKIKTLTPREAGYTFKLTDKVLLDVRPSNERQKAWVKGSTWIPVFDVDTSFDLGGAGKKFTNYVMVEEKFSKDTDIIVVCQKGLSWTDQQRAQAVKEGLGYRLIFTGRLVGALVLVDALFLGAQRIGPLLQELQSR